MQIEQKPGIATDAQMMNWWATGDTPVRNDSRVAYFVDGRITMMIMCRHFIKARHYIYMANWGLTAGLELVRGTDHCAEPDCTPKQEALLAELRAEGLQEADIAFWRTHDLSVENVLGYAVSKGVEVKVLLWKSPGLFSHYNVQETYERLNAVGATCILDDSAEGIIHHPIESLHQKIAIVDGTHAFVGGIDPLIEKKGEFDRWDTHMHPFSTLLRRTREGTTPHPWHDVHSLIEGPAAGDVEYNFRQRWNDVVDRHRRNKNLLVPEHPLAAPLKSKTTVQVIRTIPEHTYHFEPMIVRGIAQVYAHAFHNIQRFVYLENQYLWLRTYTGIDIPFLGNTNEEMEENIRELCAALRRGAALTIIIPDHPNVGRSFTDASLIRIREEAPEAVEEGRLHVFCLATSTREKDVTHYRPVYVHAKVAIVDDVWTTVGSGNLNNRGMRDDTEINVATLDAELATDLRLMLQSEHLGLVSDDDLFGLSRLLGQQIQAEQEKAQAIQTLHRLQDILNDPLIAMRMMYNSAWDNLRRYKANMPLVGHLLPYLTAGEAHQQNLNFRESHGWIEEES